MTPIPTSPSDGVFAIYAGAFPPSCAGARHPLGQPRPFRRREHVATRHHLSTQHRDFLGSEHPTLHPGTGASTFPGASTIGASQFLIRSDTVRDRLHAVMQNQLELQSSQSSRWSAHPEPYPKTFALTSQSRDFAVSMHFVQVAAFFRSANGPCQPRGTRRAPDGQGGAALPALDRCVDGLSALVGDCLVSVARRAFKSFWLAEVQCSLRGSYAESAFVS